MLLAAGDTFRAAAAEQLQAWAERAGAGFYGPKREGHRPDALLYEVRRTHLLLDSGWLVQITDIWCLFQGLV